MFGNSVGMLAAAFIAAAGGGSSTVDDYYNQVSLHLNFDGANGGTTFTDNKGHAVTRNGTPTISTAQSKFGGSSGLFNGSTDYLSIANQVDVQVSTDDFTIECWLRTTTTGTLYLFGTCDSAASPASTGLSAWLTNGVFNAGFRSGTTLYQVTAGAAINDGSWHHVALVRASGTLKCYVDGAGGTGLSANVAPNATSIFSIGAIGAYTSNRWNGNIDEFRFTKNYARYTGNFTPSSTAFLTTGPSLTYAAWNPSDKNSNVTLSNNNRTASNVVAAYSTVRANMAKTSGKWYWEIWVDQNQTSGVYEFYAGLSPLASDIAKIVGYDMPNGYCYSSHANEPTGTVWSCMWDADNRVFQAKRNGVLHTASTLYLMANPVASTTLAANTYYPTSTLYTGNGGIAEILTLNAGQKPFAYAPPAGYNFGLYN